MESSLIEDEYANLKYPIHCCIFVNILRGICMQVHMYVWLCLWYLDRFGSKQLLQLALASGGRGSGAATRAASSLGGGRRRVLNA